MLAPSEVVGAEVATVWPLAFLISRTVSRSPPYCAPESCKLVLPPAVVNFHRSTSVGPLMTPARLTLVPAVKVVAAAGVLAGSSARTPIVGGGGVRGGSPRRQPIVEARIDMSSWIAVELTELVPRCQVVRSA